MADAEGDLLMLLLDTAMFSGRPVRSPEVAASGPTHLPSSAQAEELLAQVLAFTNAYTMLNKQSQLAVFAVHNNFSHLIHLGLGEDSSSGSVFPSHAIHAQLMQLLTSTVEARASSTPHGFALSGALSRALCLIHRLQAAPARQRARGRPRVLVLQASPDIPMQYIPVMNAIFSANRAEVVVDALVLGPHDSSFLQQACHITHGQYQRPRSPSALLQYLLNSLACDTATRASLALVAGQGVDFRAACFCHKRTIDLGYVCSVCLSIFCQHSRQCSTCGTHFGVARGPGAKTTASAPAAL